MFHLRPNLQLITRKTSTVSLRLSQNLSPFFSVGGFILLPLLILILVISLFGLYVLTTAGLSIKMQSQLCEETNLRLSANAILSSIEKKVNLDTPSCIVHPTNPTLFTQYPKSWWSAYACSGHFKHIHYYYVIENLGEDVCAIANNADVNADYYRITLLALMPDESQTILQSTIAKGKKSLSECAMHDKHPIVLGKQMQRELIRRVTE